MYKSKKIPYSFKRYVKEVNDRLKMLAGLCTLLVLIFYLVLPSFRWWLLTISILVPAWIVGLFLSIHTRKKQHLVKVRFDENKNKFIVKSNSGKILKIPPHWIGRVQKNKNIKMWSYSYIEDKTGDRLIPIYFSPGKKFDDNKGRHKLRATLVPYEVDEWIQRIKANHQTEENHDLIVRN